MGAVVGFVVGYLLGAKGGEGGYQEIIDAWNDIRASAELRDMLAGGLDILKDALSSGRSYLAERLENGGSTGGLRRVA